MIQMLPKKGEEMRAVVKSLIQREQSAKADPLGVTPLVAVAEKLKRLKPESSEVKAFDWAVRRILEVDIFNFNRKELADLYNLLYLSRFRYEYFWKELSAALRNYPKDKVGERAELLRASTKINRIKISVNELKSETAIKEQFPWHWVDSAINLELWDLAVMAVIDAAGKNESTSIPQLLLRLPAWTDIAGDRFIVDLMRQLMPELSKGTQRKLLTWCSAHAIDVDWSDKKDDIVKRLSDSLQLVYKLPLVQSVPRRQQVSCSLAGL